MKKSGNCLNLLLAAVTALWKRVTKPKSEDVISFSDFVDFGFTPINGRTEVDSIWYFQRSFYDGDSVVQLIYTNDFRKRLEIRHIHKLGSDDEETFWHCAGVFIETIGDLKWIINHLSLFRSLNYGI